jgi:hypothetical protein
MIIRFATRATCFSLAAIVTLAMLGTVDFLASAEPAAALIAAAAQMRV